MVDVNISCLFSSMFFTSSSPTVTVLKKPRLPRLQVHHGASQANCIMENSKRFHDGVAKPDWTNEYKWFIVIPPGPNSWYMWWSQHVTSWFMLFLYSPGMPWHAWAQLRAGQSFCNSALDETIIFKSNRFAHIFRTLLRCCIKETVAACSSWSGVWFQPKKKWSRVSQGGPTIHFCEDLKNHLGTEFPDHGWLLITLKKLIIHVIVET